MTYALILGPAVYDSYRDGRPFTLVDCVREAYGTRGVRIARLERDVWRVIVRDAGSTANPWTYVQRDGSERLIRHRRTRHALLSR